MIYYIKIFISVLYLFLSSVISIIYCLFRPADPRNLYFSGRIVSIGLLKILGIKVEIYNKHLLNEYKNVIFISNHQHNLDAFVIGSFIPYKTVSIAKREILYIPFFGLFYYLSGNILIKRQDKKKAQHTLNIAGKKIKKGNLSIWIMPEGTRNHGKMNKFKKGAFHLAIDIKSPLVPVSISSYKDLNINTFKTQKIKVHIHQLISTTKLEIEDLNNLSNTCYDIIKKKSSEL